MASVWLDDERDPCDPNTQKLFGSIGNEVWVKSSVEAINLLKNGDVQEISLDHDLGEGGTGMEVARWIEEEAFFERIQPLKWRIHSANPVGVDNMKLALKKADKYWNFKAR